MTKKTSKISRRQVVAGSVAAGAAALATQNGTAMAVNKENNNMTDDMTRELQTLLDKQAIKEVLMTYCRGIDRLDEAMIRSVFHPDSQHMHGFEGPSSTDDGSDDFVGYALGFLGTFSRTHHHLGNFFIDVEGDVAFSEAYFTAHHRRRAKGGPLAGDDATETEMDYFVAGRYLDRLEKRDGQWKITHRTGLTDWSRLENPTGPGLDGLPNNIAGQHGPDDLVYHIREQYGD
jgi:hypothetical protein